MQGIGFPFLRFQGILYEKKDGRLTKVTASDGPIIASDGVIVEEDQIAFNTNGQTVIGAKNRNSIHFNELMAALTKWVSGQPLQKADAIDNNLLGIAVRLTSYKPQFIQNQGFDLTDNGITLETFWNSPSAMLGIPHELVSAFYYRGSIREDEETNHKIYELNVESKD